MSDHLSVFVDSDAFVALAIEKDSNHNKALKTLSNLIQLPVFFITSNYVFSETITVISYKAGHNEAMNFINKIRSNDERYTIKWVDQVIELTALNIFSKQTSKNVSFIDCTNMALVKHENLDAIFSFDEIYKKNGYRMANTL